MAALRPVWRHQWVPITVRICNKRFTHNLPVIATCPSPSCICQETPPGLDINRELPLGGTMPAYTEHVIFSTGRTNWTSRIEDDEGLDVVKKMKSLLTRDGKYSEVSNSLSNALFCFCCALFNVKGTHEVQSSATELCCIARRF